ncbi:Succinate dehydrogenase [ubiquinone] cytochrome b small subunit, mitochondrial [Smittium mucronatum]|uniref:Succinate dehydrogenase [ubiquinone] cytochrome b small subunit n=1 Tax=Smittium mucronatum TaxID=133383 RepID=A0A1R0GUF5_9FUNG|nr:Succinate dehydrogenase [ubiquinone] cytochrome b small subunit, mitochondrial [Smittium mucronatum]
MFGLTPLRLFPRNVSLFAAARVNSKIPTMVSPMASLMNSRNTSLFHSSTQTRLGKEFHNPEAISDLLDVPVLPQSKSAVTEETLFRMVSFSLVPILGVSFFYGPQPINDLLLGIVFPIHAYFGVTSSIVDYVPRRRFPKLNLLFTWMLNIGTLLALYGCWVINTTDVGLTAFAQRVWRAKDQKKIE